MSTLPFARSHLSRIEGYRPSSPLPSDRAILKLNCNENPYPPSPAVLHALKTLDSDLLRQYPDPTGAAFREVAGQLLEIPSDWICLGNGSDHLLQLIFQAFVEAQDTIAYPWPTYPLYTTLGDLAQAQAIALPFLDDKLPVDALTHTQAKATLVASPASPTGGAILRSDLQILAQQLRGLLVIDEAYVDFAEGCALELVKRFPRVIILRTLSKGYSLAGLRLGFAIAQPPLIQALNQVKDSYSVDAVACQLGIAALQDQDYLHRTVEQIKRSRVWLSQQLQTLNFEVWPSETNFLWVKPSTSALTLCQSLRSQGIYVRHFPIPGISDYVRITIGTDAQNQQLLIALTHLS